MSENLFQTYILSGGWAMVLLVPASIVALATIIRAVMRLWGPSVRRLTSDVRSTIIDQKSRTALTLTDARVIASDTAASIYGTLQPLSAIYAIAPMIGALGAAWSLRRVWQQPASLPNENMQTALAQAFVPLGWGIVVGLVSILGYAILRARLVTIEHNLLAPAAIAALNESKDSAISGRPFPGSKR